MSANPASRMHPLVAGRQGRSVQSTHHPLRHRGRLRGQLDLRPMDHERDFRILLDRHIYDLCRLYDSFGGHGLTSEEIRIPNTSPLLISDSELVLQRSVEDRGHCSGHDFDDFLTRVVWCEHHHEVSTKTPGQEVFEESSARGRTKAPCNSPSARNVLHSHRKPISFIISSWKIHDDHELACHETRREHPGTLGSCT